MRGIREGLGEVALQAWQAHVEACLEEVSVVVTGEVSSASTAISAGSAIFILRATAAIAPSKQADQPAANSCSGLVPFPADPGR